MNFDWRPSMSYARSLGLIWVDFDSALVNADKEAHELGFRQDQFDAAMRHHLWQVKRLFTPQTYSWRTRLLLALHFLFGG